jgi:bifunctional UDP-N-acetylglucosamine pyrophosphorylase/glucosamine-1-phosphate N-acetyltransferase
MDNWAGVVMAAGQGARMKSRTPKALHRVCGKELIRYPVDLLRQLGIDTIVVVVSPANAGAIREALGPGVEYVVQPQPLGTADALGQALARLDGPLGHLFVQGADAPLVRLDSAQRLVDFHLSQCQQMTLLTGADVVADDLGRVLRDGQGRVTDIVEASDWNGQAGVPAEVNGGVYCFDAAWLKESLPGVETSASRRNEAGAAGPGPGPNPTASPAARPAGQEEKYLTALAAIGACRGHNIGGVTAHDATEMMGINNRLQLAQAESVLRQRIRENWMLSGVTIQDPSTVYIDADVTIGQDTVVLPNTMLLGNTAIGEECQIGPNSVVQESTVGDRCRVTASVLESSTLEEDVDVGPFSHLRPDSYLEKGVHLGNYVEVKNSRLAAGAVSGHFSYLGDASIGSEVNIGAGTITCNYDGVDKHRTVIENGAFIGCDTLLVAPVTVGELAATGAGSVVTRDVPRGKLAVGVPARIRRRREESN